MKLFLIISDSHGDTSVIRSILKKHDSVNHIIHLGDFYRDAWELQSSFPEKQFFFVTGNCDFFDGQCQNEQILEEEGMKLYLTHGHRYHVKNTLQTLKDKASNERYNVVMFGHTHLPLIERLQDDCLLINPGSVSLPKGMNPCTYALLEIGNGRAEARILEVV